MWFYLLVGHALMDYPLQGDAMASCKCRGSKHPAAAAVPWYYWLTFHALLHGGMVAVIIHWFTQNHTLAVQFGVAETVIHWLVDYGKCAGLYGIHVDQLLHVACKFAWVALLGYGLTV